MSTIFDRKSIFLHNVPAVLNGDPFNIAEWLVSHGFTAILPKCANGPYEFQQQDKLTGKWHPNVDQRFVDAMHLYGIAVIGWGFNYGIDGDGEGRIAAQICDRLGLDGWAFDIETKFESYANAVNRAGQVIGTFNKTIQKKIPLAFCSWALYWNTTSGSQIHNPKIGGLMMEYCDVIMPMIYWSRTYYKVPQKMTDEQVLLYCENSTQQQKRITSKSVIPVLRAYTGDAGFADAGNVKAAGDWTRFFFSGASWWFMDHVVKMPAIADALGLVPGWDVPEVPPVDPPPVEPPTSVALPQSVTLTFWADGKTTATDWKKTE